MVDEAISAMLAMGLKARLLRTWERANSVHPFPFSERELLVLEILGEFGPVTEAGFSKIFGLSPSSLAELVRKLLDSGMAMKGKDEKDARQKPLVLTAQGQEFLAELREDTLQRAKYLLADLSPDDVKAATAVFTKMHSSATRRVKMMIFGQYTPKETAPEKRSERA